MNISENQSKVRRKPMDIAALCSLHNFFMAFSEFGTTDSGTDIQLRSLRVFPTSTWEN